MSQVFQTGEHQVGRYRVQFARFSEGGWQTQGPWMRVIITNRRLIVLPDEVRREDPTPLVIPARDVVRVWSVGLGKRDGGVIELSSGDLLYFYVDWSQSARLVRDIRAMIQPRVAGASRAKSTDKRFIN